MIKKYGIDWWTVFIPQSIKDKHQARLGGYKSIVKGYANVNEKLMSIDIDDLIKILTLKCYKWHPSFNDTINKFLNNLISLKEKDLKDILASQANVTINLWDDVFSNYMTKETIDKLKVFSLNRNHVVHNKLIDRDAFNLMLGTMIKIEENLNNTFIAVTKDLKSDEENKQLEELSNTVKEIEHDALIGIMESEAGVRIRNNKQIIELFDERLTDSYYDLVNNLRFRNDILIENYQGLNQNSGMLFCVKHKVNNNILTISYSLDDIDGCPGEVSSIKLVIKIDTKEIEFNLRYINGEAALDSYQSNYMPEVKDEIYESDFEKLNMLIENLLDEFFEDVYENVLANEYERVTEGGENPIAEGVACEECGEECICVDKNYAQFGTCLKCGYINELTQCEICGSYIIGNSEDKEPQFCEDCEEYFDEQ